MAQKPGSSWTEGPCVARLTHVRPSYAFEQFVRRRLGRPQGACEHLAPAGASRPVRTAAQRKR